jgi:K+-sensing histidine kinase KdpD
MTPQMPQMHQPLPPQMSQHYMNYNIEQMEPQQRPKKKTQKKRSKIREICSMSTLRKILVITILYVVVSHNKTSLLLCNNVPYVCITNALSYNVLKGIIMALVIVLTWGFM